MSDLIPFAFEDQLVRSLMRDGEPWFVANDVCRALDLSNARKAVADLDDDEKGVTTSDTLGGIQQVNIISEPGCWSLVFRSRKPEAERFKRWLAHDVLPALRRTGRYEMPGAAPPPMVETWEADSLSSRIAAVEAARRLYGRAAARDLWPRLGLPQIAPAESSADPAQDRACLDRLLSADLADAAGVPATVREALAAAWSGDRMMRARLDAAGLRADGGGFWVANRASFLERLFRDTAWAAGGWRFALRRLPGCHGMKHLNNRSIAGMKQRATWVDAALVKRDDAGTERRCP